MAIDNWERKRRNDAIEALAKKYGRRAPFPTANLFDRYLRWNGARQLIESNEKIIASDKAQGHFAAVRDVEGWNVKHRQRMARLKLPPEYVSWEHVKEFNDLGSPPADDWSGDKEASE